MGYPLDTLMGQRQRGNEENWYVDMDASRALCTALGYRRLVKLSCLPSLRGVMNAGYRFFARRRIRLGQWWEKRYNDNLQRQLMDANPADKICVLAAF